MKFSADQVWEVIKTCYLDNEKTIYAIASKYFKNECDRQEVIQEALIKVAGKADTILYLTPQQRASYLCRSVENICINHYRRQVRNAASSLSDIEWDECADDMPSLYETILQKEITEIVRGVLSELEPTDRILLVGKYITGFSTKELAAEIGCSVGTTAVKLHRAKKRAIALFTDRGMIYHE